MALIKIGKSRLNIELIIFYLSKESISCFTAESGCAPSIVPTILPFSRINPFGVPSLPTPAVSPSPASGTVQQPGTKPSVRLNIPEEAPGKVAPVTGGSEELNIKLSSSLEKLMKH